MQKKRIEFIGVWLNSSESGSEAKSPHMISKVYFKVDNTEDVCDILQSHGDDYETSPIQLVLPPELKKSFHYEDFREAVENYYRAALKMSFNLRVGANKIVMKDGRFKFPGEAMVREAGLEGGGW